MAQRERVGTSGSKLKLFSSVSIPVEMNMPLFGHLIIMVLMIVLPRAGPVTPDLAVLRGYERDERVKDRGGTISYIFSRGGRYSFGFFVV